MALAHSAFLFSLCLSNPVTAISTHPLLPSPALSSISSPITQFQHLAICLHVLCRLSTSFRRPSPISTAFDTATGALPALHLVPLRVSHFNSVQQGYKCIASSPPRSDARPPFQQHSTRLQVRCQLSTPFRCASPISTAFNTAIGALPALHLVPMRVSHFNRVAHCSRCVASTPARFDARYPFQPRSTGLQQRCQLYLVPTRVSPISTACYPAAGALPAIYLVLMRVYLFNCYRSPYMFTACVN